MNTQNSLNFLNEELTRMKLLSLENKGISEWLEGRISALELAIKVVECI